MYKEFVKLTEKNDHEGESWNFWLQLDGNEKALERLKKIIDLAIDAGFAEEYSIDMTPVSEKEVDIVVKHTGQGYMDYNNKVTGTLTLPDFDDALFNYEDEIDDEVFKWQNDHLYKGGVRELFK